MKSIFILIIIVFFSFNLNAQLIADAGNDTILCCCAFNDENELITLGGNPGASGGVEPYTYTWSGKLLISPYDSIWIHASDILDDTTKSNPILKKDYAPEEWFTFYLKVIDAVGNIQYDSVNINLSYFGFLLVYILPDTIFKGDSTQLIGDPYVVSNFPPFEYTISPSHGLTDSTDIFGWAKPDTSISYYLQAINSAGCVSEKIYYWHIEVVDTTTASSIVNKPKIQCYLNHGNLIVNLPGTNDQPYNLAVTTTNGRTIHSNKYRNSSIQLSNLGLKENQIYLVSIISNKERKVFKLFNNPDR